MIRRHPWVSAGIALTMLAPIAVIYVAGRLWWDYQGKQAWGRP